MAFGMRRGEAVALQWSDIDDGKDTGAPTITISKNAVMDKAQPTGRLIKQTKTGEIRAVPISEATLQMLQELKQETERIGGTEWIHMYSNRATACGMSAGETITSRA